MSEVLFDTSCELISFQQVSSEQADSEPNRLLVGSNRIEPDLFAGHSVAEMRSLQIGGQLNPNKSG
jgi:hypothetical protein